MSSRPAYEADLSSNAAEAPRRVVFVTRKTSAKVRGAAERQLMAYPHLVLREAIALELLTVLMVVVSLFWDAPLENLANPLVTPNPAKAPWYFLGLQELLHYFPPVVAGIIIPTLVVIGLVVIPYSKVNIEGAPLLERQKPTEFRLTLAAIAALLIMLGIFEAWTVLAPTALTGILMLMAQRAPKAGGWRRYLRRQPLSWWVMSWFIVVAVALTLVGTFFRGPGWSWVWPWSGYAG